MFGLFGNSKKDYEAKVSSSGQSVTVPAGENLLKAALAAGLDWPHDCRVGSCGTCKCTLQEGKIKPLSDFAYVLDGEQLQRGMILACQSQLRSDVVIEVELGAGEPSEINSVPATISATRMLTGDIMEIRLTATSGLPGRYKAGQYVDIAIPGIDAPRSYSFASPPSDSSPGDLTFFVRKVPNGELTGWLFSEDRRGQEVTVTGPFGNFWLRNGPEPFVCIAGGSGMSAIKALLEQANAEDCGREVVYLFGARTQQDLYCLDEMRSLETSWNGGGSFKFIPVLSEEPADSDWRGLRGMVTDYIDEGLRGSETQAYLCGPPPMIDAAVELLVDKGISQDAIHFDKFLDASTMPGGR